MKAITTARWVTAILFLSLSMQVFAQIVPADYYNRLFYLCKVWGHAKYFHTEIAKGKINWDDQLLSAINGIKNATSNDQFSTIVLQMLNSAGPMGTSTVPLPTIPDELNNNKDHSWMDQPIFSPQIKSLLWEINDKFRPQSNAYVGQAFTDGNPTFDTDNQYYTGSNYPSEELRLLALFRFWNIHNYFLPYKNQLVNDWDQVLVEFIPKMVEATNAIEFNLSLKELLARLVDAHSMLFSPVYTDWVGTSYPPFQVRIVENQTVISKVLPESVPLAVGDIVQEIDGFDINTYRSNLRKYGFGSNDPAIDFTVTNLIMWGDAGRSQLTAYDGTNTSKVDFARDNLNSGKLLINDSPIWTTKAISGCTFGIVDLARLETTQVEAMFRDLRNTNAIIFDIRGYPKKTLWILVNYLFPGPIHIADLTAPDITYPGRLYWHSEYIGTGGSFPSYRGKVIMLFDERSRSLSEYTCMGLEMYPDAIKIGSTTAGADGNVSFIYLTGNCYITMNGLGCFYPDRTPRSRLGIIPDYEVHPTIAGIKAGRDELMEFALNCALLNVHPGYCTSAGNATTEWISSVTLGTHSKTSGSSATIGYENFSSTEFRVEAGKTYPISLLPGFTHSTDENWAVWIDYNGDKGFDETGELVFSKSRSDTAVSGTIVIPAGLSITTRMRVSMSSSMLPGPCSMLSAGEVEDYTLIISSLNQVDIPSDLSQVVIYPNPVSRQLNIQVGEFSDQTELSIYSLDGKLIHKDRLTANLTTIDVSKWDCGIYLVRLTCGGHVFNQKFVKD